jgi:hypothetical protein
MNTVRFPSPCRNCDRIPRGTLDLSLQALKHAGRGVHINVMVEEPGNFLIDC